MMTWFRNISSENRKSSARIIFFHYAGGSSSSFLDWAQHFDPSIELLSLELPGRGSRFTESFEEDIHDVINTILIELKNLPELPTLFFGHSMGALIAYLTASKLAKNCDKLPFHLVVSGKRALHIKRQDDKKYHLLADNELLQELKNMNGMPSQFLESTELIELYLPIIRADFKLSLQYSFNSDTDRITLPCNLTCFYGDSEENLVDSDIQAWSSYTSEKFEKIKLRGGHFFINNHKEYITSYLQKLFFKH